MSSAIIRDLGREDYLPVWEQMKSFTDNRDANTQDEFWLVEHPPVFTQGQAGKAEHFIHPTHIPIVQSDRGGQVTYHGPGQIVIYTLCQLKPIGLGVRGFVSAIENAIIALLKQHDIHAVSRPDAPGVYINDAKIAALGLRVRKGCTYHGLALNVDLDLTPYQVINPCGYAGMQVTSLKEQGVSTSIEDLSKDLLVELCKAIYGEDT